VRNARHRMAAATLVACFTAGCGARRDAVHPVPQATPSVQTGTASWYGRQFAGRRTASGEVFRPQDLTAAHRTLPFGTRVRVTNLDNGRSAMVRINDRGPFARRRILDCSEAAARRLGFRHDGTARVRIEWTVGAR